MSGNGNPYVDTRDRDVAGLLRGLSGAINAVADEVLKRSDATLARDRRLDMRAESLESALSAAVVQMPASSRSASYSHFCCPDGSIA